MTPCEIADAYVIARVPNAQEPQESSWVRREINSNPLVDGHLCKYELLALYSQWQHGGPYCQMMRIRSLVHGSSLTRLMISLTWV